MKKALDNFSKQANVYKKFRPTYPEALYTQLLAHVKNTGSCWDCGTGNGQVAMVLSEYFDAVCATDLSEGQIRNAPKKTNITYGVERAEKTGFDDNTFDLITVAQALHWFDFDAFHKEVKRVAKKGAIYGAWGYGLLRIDPTLNERIDFFYKNIIGPYWNTERRHIDTAYREIPFDFEPIPFNQDLHILVEWDLQHFKGYLDSWSSVQNYLEQHPGEDPVKEFISDISPLWNVEEKKEMRFPIFSNIGRVLK